MYQGLAPTSNRQFLFQAPMCADAVGCYCNFYLLDIFVTCLCTVDNNNNKMFY